MLRVFFAAALAAPSAFAAPAPALDRARLAPVPSAGRAAPVPSRPSWLVVEGSGEELEKTAAKIERAAELLARTATGRSLAPTLAELGGKVRVREGGSFMVTDADNEVSLGPEFALSRDDATLAVLFSHELEHLRQRSLGLSGETARGVRELAAFLVQTRAWVESGAPIDDEDLKGNWNNSHDMIATLEFPATAMAVLALRAGWRPDLSNKKVREYWSDTLAEHARWAARWKTRFPKRDARKSAEFVLKQSLNFNGVRETPSPWLPDALERLMTLRPGQPLLLPGEPNEADKALLDAHVLAPALERGESGSWALTVS